MSSAEVATASTIPAATQPRGGRRSNNRARGGTSNKDASVNVNTNTSTSGRGAGSGGSGNRNPRQGQGNRNQKGKDKDGAQQSREKAKEQSLPPTQQKDLVQPMAAVALSETGDDIEVCWICAEPIKYYAVSECNHRTCHVCAIRLRALYKKTDCTFCKEPITHVIFTNSPDAPYSSYDRDAIPYKDSKLSVSFEMQEMMEDALILLRFNCADPECEYIGNGWGDLRLHVRATHGKLMCDLCMRHKKVFAHEHVLYTTQQLTSHLPSWGYNNRHQSSSKHALKEPPDGGVHPLCEFCKECYFGDDELYAHMREKHEECFVCKRNEVRDKYFQNYEALERHFNTDHYPCTQPDCLARKFVVFNTPIDLKAHMVEEHGSEMNARDMKEARRIQAEFTFEEIGHSGRHGGRNRDRDNRDRERDNRDRDGREREREREPQPPQQPQPQSQGSGSNAVARGAGNRRREGFGGALTTDAGSNNAAVGRQQTRPSTPQTQAQASADIDPAVAERHQTFLTRLQHFASNPAAAVPAVRAATRGYRNSESSARDLILTIWNVLDCNLEHTASIVNMFIDLLDEEEKKQDLLKSWRGFDTEQRQQFPDLTPSGMGSAYAGITSGRVLNVKHSTAGRSSRSQQVWNRVALAANNSATAPPPGAVPKPRASGSRSSTPVPGSMAAVQAQFTQEKFPALPGASAGANLPAPTPAYRQGPRTTPWSASSAQPATLRAQPVPTSVNMLTAGSRSRNSGGNNKQTTPKLSHALFPELPMSSINRAKPQVRGNVSLKNILGAGNSPAANAWGGSPGGDGEVPTPAPVVATPEDGDAGAAEGQGGGKGKKGKGKQKQTLFTLGSFPT